MKVIFRADASYLIGTGHIMRCITMADALDSKGVGCYFICREIPGNLIEFIQNKGFFVHVLPYFERIKEDEGTEHQHFLCCSQSEDAADCITILESDSFDCLVVDHYALDCRWENQVKPLVQKLMVIDDLADRIHNCDLLLDQTLGRNNHEYEALTPQNSTLLCGAQFALLRPEFSAQRQESINRRAQNYKVNHLVISMGGVDKDNITGKVLEALPGSDLPDSCMITVVMGGNAPWIKEVTQQAERMLWKTKVVVDVEKMADLMMDSDFAIGAAGTTAWERCCLGLPSIMIVLADNQKLIASSLEQAGAAFKLSLDDINKCKSLINYILNDSSCLIEMSHKAAAVTNGNGIKRVVEALTESGSSNEINTAM